MFVVFDLDGTLANIDHRLHHVKNGNSNWDEFFLACENDEPVKPLLQLMTILRNAGHPIAVWSGRSDIAKVQTEEWFRKHLRWVPKIRMRKQGDYTKDVDLKRSWLHEIPERFRPDIIFDDRQSVVDMWRSEGILCCQVASWPEVDKVGEDLENDN